MFRAQLTFLLLFISFFTKAQEPVSIHLSEKDGLPDKEFYNIIEDTKGFIWLCADKGLFRYDGKSFKNYSNKEKRGLSVFGVQEDADGNIWCNNISGQFFYVKENKLVTFIDLSKELKGELALFRVRKKHVIVFSQNTIYYINRATKLIEKTHFSNFSYSLNVKVGEAIYLATTDSIAVINSKTEYKNLFPTNLSTRDKNGVTIIHGKTEVFQLDSLFFLRQVRFHKNKFYQIDFHKNKLLELGGFENMESESIQHIFKNGNQIWFSTTNGVYVYNFSGNKFYEKRQFLKGKNVTKTIKDKDGNYWFTTLNRGIYVMPNIFIETYDISETHKKITALDKVDSQTLFFGSNNGDVSFFNIKTNKEFNIEMPEASKVSAIAFDSKKKLGYIGKQTKMHVLDKKTLKCKVIFSTSSAKSFSILNNNDVFVVDYKTTTLLKYANNYKPQKLLLNRRPYTSFYSKKNNAVFVGYVDGLVKYNAFWNPKTILYKNNPIYGLSITETKDGVLWVATFKDGIFGIKNDTVIHHFTTKERLVSNRIEKIEADKTNLWIATDAGIQFLNTKKKSFKTLTKRDGIISYDISGIEIMDDKVVFSSSEGLFSVDKKRAFKAQKEVKVYFTNIEIDDKKEKLKSNYQLAYNQNAVKISFNVNGLIFNQKGKYKYRLLGYNDSWITTAIGESSVKYNSLPAGDYIFQVQPFLDLEENKSEIKSLNFSIKKPFWETWWFILGILILVLGSIILYFRRKIKKKEQQRELEINKLSLDNELIALKLENLRSQMNPHFIFNALNSIQEYIILNQKKLASEYLGKFADLIRTYLNHSSKGKITLKEEIDCLEMYLELEKLRFEDKLNYSITNSENLIPDAIYIPTMLIQPYVENALKHGLLHRKNERILTINFSIDKQNSVVKCVIIDNGVGREKAEEFKARSGKNHKSFATKATKDRLALLNYGKEKQVGVNITDLLENNTPKGTQVNITIPYTTI
ncbi:sensor histidine kinase [Polaribacter cellanae]|uniref:Histidine kinase n=1 Tax=Polaribacter cellanae TaxID=2818493 RepID=A0A975H616_9FLAO|nr:histidine kinase [Polaribacter cellanae]QTE21449.1 histidine kinase [Polaribacter cellanae]